MKFFIGLFLFIICTFYQLSADWKVACKDGSDVTLSVCKGNLDNERKIFNKAFTHAYQGTEIEQMILKKYDSLARFLTAAFEDEQNDFDSCKPETLFISAKNQRGDVIGFAAFDKNTDYVYVRQLAIDPDFQMLGLGKLLTFSFLNMWKDCGWVKLLTRRLNYIAVGFYTRLGFTESAFTHGSYDPAVYIGMDCHMDSGITESLLKKYTLIS